MCGRKREQTGNLSYRYALYPGWISSRRFCQQMRKDNIDFSLVQQELVHIRKKEAKGKIRGRLLEVIRGPVTQLVMCSLVLIDALIVTAEIILEIHAVKAEKLSLEHELRHQQRAEYFCQKENALHIQRCCYPSADNWTSINFRIFGFDYSFCCPANPLENCNTNTSDLYRVFFSESTMNHLLQTRCSKLSCCTEATSLYRAYPLIRIYCTGRRFFRLKFEVVDGSVIAISLIADVIFVYVASDEISIIIIFLVWRMVRVINSLLMHEKQRDAFRIQLQKRARRISELKVEVLNAKKTILEKHIDILESSCIQLGMSKEQLLLCRPNVTNVGEDMTKNAVRSMAFLTSEMLAQFAVGPMPSQLVPNTPKKGGQIQRAADDHRACLRPGSSEYRHRHVLTPVKGLKSNMISQIQ
ncbi:Voltage-gated hydrogen channel 1 [Sparganum proliferum]